MQDKIKYSVVIPTYNRAKMLAETIASVFNQTISKDSYEIVVVDDGSSDDTKKVVDDFNNNQPEFKIGYFFQKNSGCAKARNTGILNSKGDIIFFTDDDCVVPHNWIEKISDAFKRYPEAVGAGGWTWPTEEILKKNKFYQFYQFQAYRAYPGIKECEIYTNTIKSPAGNTANVAYKKSVLMEAGLFDEKMHFTGCVDWELKYRLIFMGYSLVYIPLHVRHKKEMIFREFFFKSLRQGRGRDYYNKKFGMTQALPEQSFRNFLKEISLWRADRKKRPFLLIYAICLFARLCGRYFNKITGFKPIRFMGFNRPEKDFYHIILPDGRLIKEEIIPYGTFDYTKLVPGVNDDNINEPYRNEEVRFSIVVATFNRGTLILDTLKSLIRQTIENNYYEIIIIDDGSTDETGKCVKQFIGSHSEYKMRYLRQENAGPAAARNKGIKEARGEIIFFTDDDCIVPEDWMEKIVEIYEYYPEVSGVGGWLFTPKVNSNQYDYYIARRQCPPKTRFWGKYGRNLQTLILTNLPSRNIVCNTANVSFKKKVLENIGGFSEYFKSGGSEGFDLGLRALEGGYLVVYLPRHVVHQQYLDKEKYTSLVRKQFESRLLFLRNKTKIPRAILEFEGNYTVMGLIKLFLKFIINPFAPVTAIKALEYAIKLQISFEQNIKIEDFREKSYDLHPDIKD